MKIKHRTWNIKDKEFIDNDIHISYDGDLYEVIPVGITSGYSAAIVTINDQNNYIVELSVLKVDKLGIEIYNGDIIKFYGYMYEVYYDEEFSSYGMRNNIHPDYDGLGANSKDMLIVGNIHQDANLLPDKREVL